VSVTVEPGSFRAIGGFTARSRYSVNLLTNVVKYTDLGGAINIISVFDSLLAKCPAERLRAVPASALPASSTVPRVPFDLFVHYRQVSPTTTVAMAQACGRAIDGHGLRNGCCRSRPPGRVL
jgi:hypothetical protein